jgi:hypothetical protein
MKRYLVIAASMSVLGFASAHAQTFPSTSFDNSARITQTGNLNEAEIDQAAGGIINGQGQAEIIQRGNRNDASITQTSATSPFGSGFANTALIDQRRARGDASIDQVHDYFVSRNNNALIVQITPDATASIQQRGDRNTGTIRQLTGSVVPVASIDQNGRINTAIVEQRGSNGVVEVVQGTFQAGPGASPVTFNSRVDIDNDGANAGIFVSQIGFNHNARVIEDGANGVITITMAGSSNAATVTQESRDGLVEIEATGSANIAEVTQASSDEGSIARVIQSGNFAVSEIEQLDDVTGGGLNIAEVNQTGLATGSGNILSTILQNGGTNLAFVDQASAYAQSDIIQTGTGHLANVAQ